MIEKARNWWQARTGREQNFLLAWSVSVVLLLLGVTVFLPLTQRIQYLDNTIPQLEADLHRMRLPSSDPQRRPGAGGSTGADLRSALFKLLADRAITAELRSVSGTRIEVRLPKLPIREAVDVLEFLRDESGARIVTLTIRADPGADSYAQIVAELERPS